MKRGQSMKNFLAAMLVLFFAVGVVDAKDYEITKKTGDYVAHISMDKNPPVTGKNHMAVGIKDGAGKDLTDAAVTIDYGMPAMPGMPAMNYKTGAGLKDKRYLAILDFSMSGAWNIHIKITRGGKTQSVKLNVDVQ
jgi:hypothetical protein